MSNPTKTVAIIQSCYIPWKGYFDMIGMVDEFILYDDAQYTRRDWRNRNKIKSAHGATWLTIPVQVKGRYHQSIAETQVDGNDWAERHLKTISHAYAKAPFFAHYRPLLESLYLDDPEVYLSQVNFRFLKALCSELGISTRLRWSREFELPPGKTERLVAICRQAGAGAYLSGPSAAGYIDQQQFESAGIGLRWMDYGGYPEYHQLYPPFEHGVSILDLLLNEGPNARAFMKGA